MKPPAPRIPDHLKRALGPLARLGVLDAAVVAITAALVPQASDATTAAESAGDGVIHAIAMVCIAKDLGHSCLRLDDADNRLNAAIAHANRDWPTQSARTAAAFSFPSRAEWVDALRASALVTVMDDPVQGFDRPLVLDADRGVLWLARYAFYEHELATRVLDRAAFTTTTHARDDVTAALDGVLAANESPSSQSPSMSAEQRDAVLRALTQPLTFLVGGPGTGKTWTVGRLVATAQRLGVATNDIALAAPTGKAAERMTQSIATATDEVGLVATTIHRLLGLQPGTTSPPGDVTIPHRLVIVDEASMIDLPTMARVVAAVSRDAHLVIVGDPNQLASVDVGSVLADVVDAATPATSALHRCLAPLVEVHRQAESSPIIVLARAIRGIQTPGESGALDDDVSRRTDPHDVMEILQSTTTAAPSSAANRVDVVASGSLGSSRSSSHEEMAPLRFVDRHASSDATARDETFAGVVAAAKEMIESAEASHGSDVDALLRAFAAAQSTKVLAATRRGPGSVAEWSDRLQHELGFRDDEWKVGRPIMVTRNDKANGLSNGDTGITVADPHAEGALRVAFARGDGTFRFFSPNALADYEDWWAMTIHKSQGSEFGHVIVSLPSDSSPLLTRELLYTAVTRAKQRLTILGTPDVLQAAVATPTQRASGLAARFGGVHGGRAGLGSLDGRA